MLMLALLCVSGFALAELFGPLGKVMHTLSSDLSCLDHPTIALFCGAGTPADAVAEMISEAQKLKDHPEWVTALIPGADSKAVENAAQDLGDHLRDYQAAWLSKDASAQALALAAIHQTRKHAHTEFIVPDPAHP